jgi:hypothetical protein
MSAMERFWQLVARLDPFAKGDVTARDLRRHPVWKYALDWESLPWRDETWRRPPFRVRWRLKVPLEGESEPRAGEFPDTTTPDDGAGDGDFP